MTPQSAAQARRRRILDMLASGEKTRQQLVAALSPVREQSIDNDLKRLCGAGAITGSTDRTPAGPRRIYALPETRKGPAHRRAVIAHRPAVMHHWGHSHEITVSLPAPPWGALDPDDRSATAPCAAPIRLAGFDPLKADPVLRHADARRDRG